MLDPLFKRDPQVVRYPDVEELPLTDEAVDAAQHELGVCLPGSYVQLMGICNGGYTHEAALDALQATSWARWYRLGLPSLGPEWTSIGGMDRCRAR